MKSIPIAYASVSAAFAAVLLSACASDPATPAAPAPATPAAAAPESAADGPAALLSGTAKSNEADPGTGDWALTGGGVPAQAQASVVERWVQLSSGKAGELDPVLVNGAGLTLYRFDKDEADPSKATCNGECATTWPPVTVREGGRIFIAGVQKDAVGTVRRDDGRLQVTVGGWPVYRFAQDTKRGDTRGQGVGGTWFGVTPDGGKAGAGAGAPAVVPAEGGTGNAEGGTGNAAPAAAGTSAVLFDDAFFSDNGASQGVSGAGCLEVPRPGVASSLVTDGSLRAWAEPGCKGPVLVIDGDVADLGTLGFDDKISSLRFTS